MLSLSAVSSSEDLKLLQEKISNEDVEHRIRLLPVRGFLSTKGSLWNGRVWTDWKSRTPEVCNVIVLEIFPAFELKGTDPHYDKDISVITGKYIAVWTRTKELEESVYKPNLEPFQDVSFRSFITKNAPRSVLAFTMSGDLGILSKSLSLPLRLKLDSCESNLIAWLARSEDLKITKCPNGYNIRELSVEDAIYAHSQWKFKSNENFACFYDSAQDGLGIGAFCNTSDKLVSWCLVLWEGAISALTTIPDHRGKGLAKAVICMLSKRMIDRKMIPYVFIEKTETMHISEKLFTSLGFVVEKETFSLGSIENGDYLTF